MSEPTKEKPSESKSNRRNFMKIGLGTAAGACLGGGLCSCKKSPEKIELLSPEGEVVEVDAHHVHHVHKTVGVSSEEARKGIPGRKFVMVIDLAKCNNARKCVIECQKMHYLEDDEEWFTIKLMQDSENASPYWFPKNCFHCDNPPCVKVCPVNATYKRSDGLVLIDADRCIGCKFCMAACPYSTRVFNWVEPEIPEELAQFEFSPETSVPGQVGTVEKCDFCPDMARQGMLPHCVTACPNGVIYYGDQNEDVVSNGEELVLFSELIRERGGYRYMEELGTEPRVWYLPPRDRIFPVERGLESLDEAIKERYKDFLGDS